MARAKPLCTPPTPMYLMYGPLFSFLIKSVSWAPHFTQLRKSSFYSNMYAFSVICLYAFIMKKLRRLLLQVVFYNIWVVPWLIVVICNFGSLYILDIHKFSLESFEISSVIMRSETLFLMLYSWFLPIKFMHIFLCFHVTLNP